MYFSLLNINWQALETRIANEKLSNILWFIGIVLGTLLLKKPLALFVTKTSYKITNKFGGQLYAKKFQELVQKPLENLIQTFLFFVAVSQLSIFLSRQFMNKKEGYELFLNFKIGDGVDLVFKFFLITYTTITFSKIVDFFFFVQLQKAYDDNEKEKQQMLPLLKEVVKITSWSLGLFWVLGAVFKVNIPALITGLGIGGVAIALAAKESVENFFAAFTILADKPFQTEDLIRLGSIEGKVERIGFRSTKIRHSDGAIFVIPNKKLIGENLENLTSRKFRKFHVQIPIKYGVPTNMLRKVEEDIKIQFIEFNSKISNVGITMNHFNENNVSLDVQYQLEFPIAKDINLEHLKSSINTYLYETFSPYTLINSNQFPISELEPKQDFKSDDEES